MRISVLIPVFNEGGSIRELLERVAAVPLVTEIIVVDDHSTDATAGILAGMKLANVKVVTHPENRGKGAAVRTALAVASGDVVVVQDADLEYDPNDLSRLIEPILEGRTKVVYGVRNLQGQRSLMRWGNRFLTAVTNLLYGGDLQDMETCYKMVDREVLNSAGLRSERFEIEVEITAKLLRAGHHIVQVPISYFPRREQKKLAPWKDGPHGLWALLKYRFFA